VIESCGKVKTLSALIILFLFIIYFLFIYFEILCYFVYFLFLEKPCYQARDGHHVQLQDEPKYRFVIAAFCFYVSFFIFFLFFIFFIFAKK